MKCHHWITIFIIGALPALAQESIPVPTSPPGINPVDSAVPEAVQAPEMERLLSYKSVIYTEEELLLIKEVIEAAKNNEPLPTDEMPVSMKPEIRSENLYYFPQFYLTSIAYFSPDFWVIWVNSKKITSTKTDVIPGLTITHVSPDQVEFKYEFLPTDQSDFSIKPEDERIAVNAFNRSATFMLHQNQTFSSYNWKIYEGKVKKVQQGVNTPKLNKSMSPPNLNEIFPSETTPQPPLEATPVPEKQNTTGFKGLMNRYNNLNITSP